MGFEPFPGTINVKVAEEIFPLIKEMGSEGHRLVPPDPQFCEARIIKARVGGWEAAAIFPEEGVWAHAGTLELVAPVHIRDMMGLKDGDSLKVEILRSFRPKGIVFDLDGTLIDSLGAYLEVINEVLARAGLQGVSENILREAMGRGEDPWEALIPNEAGRDKDELVARCKEINKEIFSPIYRARARLFPGVAETLENLATAGFKLGGITSGLDKKKIHEVFKKEGADHLLTELVSREDVPRSKPAPDLVVECCKRLKLSPSEVVCVGDTPLDIQMGRSAGAATVGVLSGAASSEQLGCEEPDAIIKDVSDISTVLEAF